MSNRLDEHIIVRIYFVALCCLIGWTIFANAETVDVQHRGKVSLANFSCNEVEDSSFISTICYQSEDQYLLIEMNENWFEFCDVEMYEVDGLLVASSKGEYFNAQIAHRAIENLYECKPQR